MILLHVGTAAFCDTISNAIGQAVATGQALRLLSADDVPTEWRVTCETNQRDKYTTRTCYRGTNTVMVIRWKPTSLGVVLSGELLDGSVTVAKLMGTKLGMGVYPLVCRDDYKIIVFTSQKTNGVVTVDGTNGFSEFYELDGTNSTPLNGLDYTRQRWFKEFAWEPFVNVVTNKEDRTPNNTSEGIRQPANGLPKPSM